MKYLLPCLFSLLSFSLYTQNWMPVVPGDMYHFRAADSSFITHTIQVDSVVTQNADSIFFLNKVAHAASLAPDAFYISNIWNQFLGERMVKKSNGSLLFVFNNPESYYQLLLWPYAQPGDSWMAVADSNLTATVVAASAGTILGELDSLKIISFSNGQAWILSKNHGIVQGGDVFLPNDAATLAGIETRSLGDRPLKFEDFFDFNIGDIFEFGQIVQSFGISSYSQEKWKILDKQTAPDVFEYYVEYRLKVSWSGGPNPPNVSYTYDTIWIGFHKEVYPFVDAYNRENLPLWFGANSTYATAFYQGKRIGNEPSEENEPLRCSVFPAGMFSDFYIPNESGLIGCCSVSSLECNESVYFEDFRVGLGRVASLENQIDYYRKDWLVGALVQGDTVWGNLSPDWLFTSTHSPEVVSPLSILPNPATDFIHFSDLPVAGNVWVRIVDLSGRIVQESDITLTPATRLDISTLPPALYFIQLTGKEQTWLGKFQKF